jgi:cell fate (sporulation/competence/biofilm development) regulator YmcA (YheA/YmcA/DUF963 family)
MKQQRIKGVIEKCGKIRVELNSVHWRRMNKIQRVFATVFDIPIKTAAGLNQYFHYKDGGYPKPDSPPRYADASDKLAHMFIGAEFIGEGNTINEYLEKNFGLKLVRVREPKALKLRFTDRAKNLMAAANVMHLQKIKKPIQFFRTLLDEMNDTQTTICQMSDEIKYTQYEKVQRKHLKKSSFIKAVNTKAASIRSRKKGSINKNDTICEAELLKSTIENCI